MTLTELHQVFVVVAIVWLTANALTALYGWSKGFSFVPLFVAGAFLGPVGWALVLLAVTVGAGPERSR